MEVTRLYVFILCPCTQRTVETTRKNGKFLPPPLELRTTKRITPIDGSKTVALQERLN
jgi:hypothetical protein